MKSIFSSLLLALSLAACSAQNTAPTVPETTSVQDDAKRPDFERAVPQGLIKGQRAGNSVSYLGIEYARAARWELPQSVPKFTGDAVKAADKFGPACPQDGQAVMVEDCLFLNIFTPADAQKGKAYPVVIWFHGGGLRSGEGGEGPKAWTQDGVIVVTFNYRLGALGFFNYPGWPQASPRNFGQADMAAAVNWVHASIAEFGGDPDNVTLAGHSAGGMGVQLMMVDARVRGKFARAISHAGYGAWPFGAVMRDDDPLRAALDHPPLDYMKSIPAKTLVAETPNYVLPYIGTDALPLQPLHMFRSGQRARVPYMAGFNSYDGSGTLYGAGYTPETFLKTFDNDLEIRALYASDFAVSDAQAAQRIFGDMRYGFSSRETVRAVSRVKEPGYLFYYDAPNPGQPGAFHGAQYETLFSQNDSAQKLYSLNFIKTGDPNGEGLPEWRAMSGAYMVFSPDAKLESLPELTEKLEALARYLPESGYKNNRSYNPD